MNFFEQLGGAPNEEGYSNAFGSNPNTLSLAGLIAASSGIPLGDALVKAAEVTRGQEHVNLEKSKQAQKQKMLQVASEILRNGGGLNDLIDAGVDFQSAAALVQAQQGQNKANQEASASKQFNDYLSSQGGGSPGQAPTPGGNLASVFAPKAAAPTQGGLNYTPIPGKLPAQDIFNNIVQPQPEPIKAPVKAENPVSEDILKQARLLEANGDVKGALKLIQDTKDPKLKEVFDNETGLRKEFIHESKDFKTTTDFYSKILKAAENPSAAGDVSMVFSFIKLNDPTSTVARGEQANAQNAAGVPEQVRNIYNKLLTGETLSPKQRKDFADTAGRLYEANLESHNKTIEQYTGLAKRNNLNPENVVIDYTLKGHNKPKRAASEYSKQELEAIIRGKK